MTDNEFLLSDRIQKIKSMNELHDLEHNAYISFSGGKDSTVLSALIDMALPDNSIPRVFMNTGIEYKAIVDYVREREREDKRIIIVSPSQNITEVLKTYGYPFKSKEHSLYVSVFQNSGKTKTVNRYLNRQDSRFACPEKLKYQFTEENKIKISNKCCYKLKKEPLNKWAKDNNRTITITGMRSNEGGLRAGLKGCAIFNEGKLQKFHPLQPINEEFIEWFIKEYNVKLCSLYYPPFNFKRTGCKGCPYSTDLQNQLDIMSILMPAEKKQCEIIWQPIYKEYRKLNYRLDKQINLFD